ncbi:MAG: hypothetical protein M3Y87_13570, partial [Myxococcota bacterium]|nr:hypothetical protein [Myxococcota bacterium]
MRMLQRHASILLVLLGLFACADPAPLPDAATDATVATCASPADCDDGVYCNGAERCAPGALEADAFGCAPSPA